MIREERSINITDAAWEALQGAYDLHLHVVSDRDEMRARQKGLRRVCTMRDPSPGTA